MQKLISKYGLAAHLAILAVAPLLVFPYLGLADVSKVVLWLSLLVFAWFLSAPSRINNERSTSEARRRITKSVLVDPTFWILSIVTIVAGIRALNNGISLAYDAENYLWYITDPVVSVMPASCEGAGFPFFASALFVLLAYVVAKHALGKSARIALAYSIGLMSGIAGLILLYEVLVGNEMIANFAKCSIDNPSFIGIGFSIVTVLMVAALPSMFEKRWNVAIATAPVALGGLIAAFVVFSPAYMALTYLVAMLLVLAYGIFWTYKKIGKIVSLKVLAVFGVALAVAAILIYGSCLDTICEKFAAVSSSVLSSTEADISARLNALSLKVWKTKLWLGSGLGAFPFELRFNATDADWAVISVTQVSPINGWAYLILERGIIGALLMLVPAFGLLWGYVARATSAVKELPSPLVLPGPITAVIALTLNYFNTSLFRIEALPLLVMAIALSTNSWAKEKIDGQ